MFEKGKAEGIETRGISDHGFMESIYFRDPNGYVIELAAPTNQPQASAEERSANAHRLLEEWSS